MIGIIPHTHKVMAKAKVKKVFNNPTLKRGVKTTTQFMGL